MKSAPLQICEVKLVPAASVYAGIQKAELISVAQSLEPVYHTPGSATFQSEQKHSASGAYWSGEFTYSIPSLIDAATADQLKDCAALVLKTIQGRTIVFHQNDYFSNARLRPVISTNTQRTQIQFAITTLTPF